MHVLACLLTLMLTVNDEPVLTGEDLMHGKRQVFMMLSDRPMLGPGLVPNDPLITWASVRFAGGATDGRIFWEPALPPDGIDASHGLGERPDIRLHTHYQSGPLRGQQKSFADAWADVVFELHNIAQGENYQRAWQDVLDHAATASDWLESVTRGEHRALLQTATFYRTRWRPWMRARGVMVGGARWQSIARTPADYYNWITRYQDPRGYPFADYLDGYQRAMGASPVFGLPLYADPFALRTLRP